VSPRSQLYLRVFLCTSLPFGLFEGVRAFFAAKDPGEIVFHGLFGGVLFGTLMSVALTPLHLYRIPMPHTREALSVVQRRILRSPLSFAETFDSCRAAIEGLGRIVLLEADRRAGILRARKRMTWRSWGDRLSILVRSEAAGQAIVEIKSQPRARTTVVDYGSNWKNVEAISHYLQERGSEPALGTDRQDI
jgi:hypothetical protein